MFTPSVVYISHNVFYRKVEDLQFRVEEESITKGDLEVFINFINKWNTHMSRKEINIHGWFVQGQKTKPSLCSSSSTTSKRFERQFR